MQNKELPQWGGHAWLRGQLPNQIIVRIMGGLANQLWQYCFALALYKQHKNKLRGLQIFCDISWYEIPDNEIRPFLLKEFFPEIKICRNTSAMENQGYPVYNEPLTQQFSFLEDLPSFPPAVILEGYFQHYRYFEEANSLFQPRLRPLPPEYQEPEALGFELVALHVRRGDYLIEKKQNIHGMHPFAYYKAALERVKQELSRPYIILFSDEMCWVEQYIVPEIKQLGMPYGFSDRGAVEDFSTMAQCRHFIVANSSYSQMAALLGEQSDSLVFMPTMQMLSHNIKCRDFLPPHWQELPYPFYEGEAPPPKVSVIIPVHNTRDYLARCLESVCLQSETAIEIIVVDDASLDESWDMIQNYARRDPRIVPFRHKQNKHLGGARNTGIEAARSEWLLFLDSDDYIARNTVEIFLQKASAHPQAALMVCGIVRVCDGQFSNFGGAPKSDLLINQPFEHYSHTRQPGLFHCAWGKLWRRELFAQSGLRFPEHMSMEDFVLIPRLLYYIQSQSNAALFIPERLFYYQYRADSLDNSRNEKAIQDFARAVGILDDWEKAREGSESHFLRHRVGKEVESWLVRYSGDGESLAELINALPAHHTAQSRRGHPG